MPKHILTKGPGDQRTLIPISSVDFATQIGDDVIVYMKSGRNVTMGGEHAPAMIDELIAAMADAVAS